MICFASFSGSAQEIRDTLSVSFRDLPLEIILDSITYKTGYFFSYNAEAIPEGSLYSLKRTNIEVQELMEILLVGTGLEQTQQGSQIILKVKVGANSYKNNKYSKEARVEVNGWVREYHSKDPIEGVNVFLNGTTQGTVTDKYGNYKLSNVLKGNYTLVFSHVGYETASYPLSAEPDHTYVINGLLDFKVQTLSYIEIISDPIVNEDEWPKYYRMFSKEFLGTSANASKCEILNPEVLQFSYSETTNTFKAEALEPLIIQNNALGYIINYNLDFFSKENQRTSFYGKARFESITPLNHRIQRRWKKNRLKTYNGSIFHFFKSLISDNVYEEGFKIYQVNDISDIELHTLRHLTGKNILKAHGQNEWILSFHSYVLVTYSRELESTQYIREMDQSTIKINGISLSKPLNSNTPAEQKTIIELKRKFVTLDSNGQIKEPIGLTTIGYWAWERMAEMMPADYNPKTDNL